MSLERFVTPTRARPAPAGADPTGLPGIGSPRSAGAPGEVCELCSEPLTGDHRHVVDRENRSLLCACRACSLLFEKPGAAQGRYRAVPDRYLSVEPFRVTLEQWGRLDVPVGVVFFLANSHQERTVAFYPSPGGATESELEIDAWDDIVDANPGLASVAPDVEAVLVRHVDERPEAYVVPIDRCYELVGRLRLQWRGFDGGSEVRAEIEDFFADVAKRSRPAPVPEPVPEEAAR